MNYGRFASEIHGYFNPEELAHLVIYIREADAERLVVDSPHTLTQQDLTRYRVPERKMTICGITFIRVPEARVNPEWTRHPPLIFLKGVPLGFVCLTSGQIWLATARRHLAFHMPKVFLEQNLRELAKTSQWSSYGLRMTGYRQAVQMMHDLKLILAVEDEPRMQTRIQLTYLGRLVTGLLA